MLGVGSFVTYVDRVNLSIAGPEMMREFHLSAAQLGTSLLVGPMGVVVTSLGEQTGVAVGEVSPERISEVRAKNPASALRRFTVVPR
ncbi:hypothetical protein ACIOD2_03880 [Amycolatopsis sp. NPDC088138]|uniref:hypothetical protein n=1 Tax=Amycolatopsis sp. NPDC088138 TaxID=3363938 RepID=UPI003817FE7F